MHFIGEWVGFDLEGGLGGSLEEVFLVSEVKLVLKVNKFVGLELKFVYSRWFGNCLVR